uniref:Uncharacterized protein n=1 Tax=Strongyloides stercoralis TaxID=6248 RepID=A0A0K0E1E4_STRER
MNNTTNTILENDNTTIGSATIVIDSNKKEYLITIAQFYGKIFSIVIFIITIIIIFISYYVSQKRKEATYYGVEDKLDQDFFAKNPKYIKPREEIEICHVQNESRISFRKNGSNNLEGSIKILQKKHPTSIVMNSNSYIDGGHVPSNHGRKIVLPSNRDVQIKIEAIIEFDTVKNGLEVLESVQRRITDKIEKMSIRKRKNCYSSKICGMIAMEMRHSLEQLSDDLWVVYGIKSDNTLVTSGLHNIFDNANSMNLCLKIQIIVPEKCRILAFKICRNVP